MTEPEWQRLSVREGWAEPEGPFEGVPDHLLQSLLDWIDSSLNDPRIVISAEQLAEKIALQLHISGDRRVDRVGWLKNACYGDGDSALEIIDSVLYWTQGRTAGALRAALTLGGSAWTVDSLGTRLERRVPATEQAAFETAVGPADMASQQLREAWGKVYGRSPDPSDAWDHAIKACESVLCPLVIPRDPLPTLGKVINTVRDAPAGKFTVRLTGNTGARGADPVTTLRGLLELVWASQPDRHGSGPHRAPTLEEAGDALHAAVLVVNIVRRGGFTLATTS